MRPDPPPTAAVEASRQPEESAETSQSFGSAAGEGDENAEALEPVPAPPDPPPAATVEASRQPEKLAKTSKSSGSAAGAPYDNAEAQDPAPVPPRPPPVAEACRMPPATAKTCRLPESAAGEGDGHVEAIEPMPRSPVACGEPPQANAEARRQLPEPAETCRSCESAAEITSGMAAPATKDRPGATAAFRNFTVHAPLVSAANNSPIMMRLVPGSHAGPFHGALRAGKVVTSSRPP
ncbi:MAG: hypothetical protein ABSG76_21620 [Xanthobacteraceae bacterium]